MDYKKQSGSAFSPDGTLSMPDEKEKRNLVWGEGSPTKNNQSLNYGCTNSGCEKAGAGYFPKEPNDLREVLDDGIVIGVKKAPLIKAYFPYAMICKCPACSTEFWFEITNDIANDLLKYKAKKEQREA